MKKLFFNRLVITTLVLFIITFGCEVYVRYLVESPIKSFNTIRIGISCLGLSLIWSFLFHFFKVKIQRVFNIIYVLIVTIGLFAEMCLYSFIGFFMGLGNASQGTKVTSYINDVLHSVPGSYYWLFAFLAFGLIYFIFIERLIYRKFKIKNIRITGLPKRYNVLFRLIPIFLVFIIFQAHYYSIRSSRFQDPLQYDPNYAVWLYPKNSNMSVNNYGVIMYLFSDTKSIINKTTEESVAYLYEEIDAENPPIQIFEEEVVPPDYTRTIDDTAWKALNDNTSDPTLKKLNNYFMNRNISQKNDMTGIFEGKNVIIMLLESVNEIAILNENDFPTLYKMYHDGISFRNNFSPRNNCSTGNNEMTVMTSLFTINNSCTANSYTKNYYPEAYMSMFKKLGYSTSAYHDYTQHYYYRATYLPKMGADKYYGVTDLGMSYSDVYAEWPSDKTMFIQAKDKYMSNKPFAVYFAGVTTHQTYYEPSEFGDKYTYLWKDSGYPTNLKRYLSKMKELDFALEELLNELEQDGILEDTVIALFGDHYPYGLADSNINAYLTANDAKYTVNHNSTTNHDVDRTPMLIYNSGLEEGIAIEDYTTIIDLLPTLLNLFNVDYDPRLYLGTDVFSKSHISRAYFVDGSWQDEKASYYAPSSKITYFGDEKYDANLLRSINQEINTRQSMSASAIRSNYFKYLGEGLEKYKPQEVETPADTPPTDETE